MQIDFSVKLIIFHLTLKEFINNFKKPILKEINSHTN